jgi:4-alpha-glucanotransferase
MSDCSLGGIKREDSKRMKVFQEFVRMAQPWLDGHGSVSPIDEHILDISWQNGQHKLADHA